MLDPSIKIGFISHYMEIYIDPPVGNHKHDSTCWSYFQMSVSVLSAVLLKVGQGIHYQQ